MDLKSIVHIVPDDKFLDYFIAMSEHYMPDQATYIVFSDSSELKHIKSQNDNLIILDKKRQNLELVKAHLKENSKIIFHSFTTFFHDFIKKLPDSVCKIWIFWGVDGYAVVRSSKLIGFKTIRFRFPINFLGRLKFFKNYFSSFKSTEKRKMHSEIIEHFDYCVTWLDEDYDIALRVNSKIKRLYVNYYTSELMNFPVSDGNALNFNKLLLGNSAAMTNNHVEALDYLHKVNYTGEIFCPLSYNVKELYVKNIIAYGKKLFGDKFVPMVDFMPLNEYQQLINDCGIVWMNHIRQQAAGNIFAAFSMNKIVILNPKSPMVKTFKKWDLTFFDRKIIKNKEFNQQDLIKNSKVKEYLNFKANEDFFKFLKRI